MTLDSKLINDVLDYLNVRATAPTIGVLDALMAAYVRHVPWESASRIARRARTPILSERPRWPERFWREAMDSGTGGTCFESNYAFFSLVRALGYEGHLTINNMGATIGCHTAIVLKVDGTDWLTDAGFPVYAPLPIRRGELTQRDTDFQRYTIRPLDNERYDIERVPHPVPNCFTLINIPVPEADYRAATTADYDTAGLFLDRVVINKVIDEQLWRFNSGEKPYHLELFVDGTRVDYAIEGDVAEAVSKKFGIETDIVRTALGGWRRFTSPPTPLSEFREGESNARTRRYLDE